MAHGQHEHPPLQFGAGQDLGEDLAPFAPIGLKAGQAIEVIWRQPGADDLDDNEVATITRDQRIADADLATGLERGPQCRADRIHDAMGRGEKAPWPDLRCAADRAWACGEHDHGGIVAAVIRRAADQGVTWASDQCEQNRRDQTTVAADATAPIERQHPPQPLIQRCTAMLAM